MEVEHGSRFARDLRRVGNEKLLRKIQRKIEDLEAASSLRDIVGVKKLQSADNSYRIRIWDYRLGIELMGNKVELVRFLHRRDFYRSFP